MNIVEILEARVKATPDKPAIIFQGQSITFRQLRDNTFKLANSLLNLGIKKGDKVVIYLPNCPEYLYSYLAIFCCGATAVPLDFMLTDDELISCITHSESCLLIARTKPNISLAKIKDNSSQLKNIILCQEETAGFLSLRELIAKGASQVPAVKISEQDYAIIFYTSGTTGKPKGVLINYRQLGAPPQSMGHFVKELTPEDISLCSLPFSHLGGLIYLQNNISFSMTMILMERFIPLEFLKNIQQYKVTCFWIVPSMYYAILQLKEFETADLTSVRWMVIFGAPSSAEVIRRFHQYCPQAKLFHGWGLTETNAPTTVIPPDSTKLESVGKPAPWIEIKIFSDAGQELPQGEIGEIAVRSWVVTDGYYKDPALTAETIRNGWFHTGDLGKLDAEGDLYIVGRIKEMIKVAGEIVFEPEVETAIHRHPDVAEVAVVGVPDKLRGEVPKAFVVLKEAAQLNEENLRYFLRQHLAHFKIPHYFEFSSGLPKNRVGKIDKESLRAQANK